MCGGVLFLLGNLGFSHVIGQAFVMLWPVALICVGLWLVRRGRKERDTTRWTDSLADLTRCRSFWIGSEFVSHSRPYARLGRTSLEFGLPLAALFAQKLLDRRLELRSFILGVLHAVDRRESVVAARIDLGSGIKEKDDGVELPGVGRDMQGGDSAGMLALRIDFSP